jgi:hypothetical protein
VQSTTSTHVNNKNNNNDNDDDDDNNNNHDNNNNNYNNHNNNNKLDFHGHRLTTDLTTINSHKQQSVRLELTTISVTTCNLTYNNGQRLLVKLKSSISNNH